MKSKTKSNLYINNGKPTAIVYPLSDSEFETQFNEIFIYEHYKKGRKRGVYVDLGANIGLTALYFQKFVTKYYAVEPSKDCFSALKQNTVGLPISYHNLAIYPRSGYEFLYKTASDSVPQTMFSVNRDSLPKEAVKTMPIDMFFEKENIRHVDILKVDIESAEYLLFPDSSFARVVDKIDHIIGEAHFDSLTGAIPAIIPVILKKYGFTTVFTNDINCVYNFHYIQQDGTKDKFDYETNTIFYAYRGKK